MKIVIIGNGIAGITAANEIRRRDRESEITILSREYDHFFSRTALMYEFCGQLSRKDLEPFERNHYERMDFSRISDEAISFNTETQELVTRNSGSLGYDRLLIACGSKPAKAPWQRDGIEGIGHFVTLDNLEWLKQEAKRAKSGKRRAIIVGGGLIGVEVAEILLHAGIETHFIIRDKWYWPIALNSAESAFVADHMRNHGCHVHLETEVLEALDDGKRIQSVRFHNGEELETDFLVISIGVLPATDWLSDSAIALSEDRFQGIEVDDYLQTNIPGVYSAGDCAVVTWFNGIRRPEQLWYTGRDQGLIAAANILGDQKPYKRGTLYNSAKFFDIEYTTAGLVNFPLENVTEWYQETPEKCLSQRIVVQNDAVIGFNILGSRWDHRYFVRWIEERRSLDYVITHLHEAIFDAEFSTRFKVQQNARTYAL